MLQAPRISRILVGIPKKQACGCLPTVEEAGQKNPDGKMIAVLFCIVFYWCTLMIFGLDTFTKIKLHTPSSITRCVMHRRMARLIFVGEAGKLGGSMWL